jgi:hypothetical protein
LGGVDEGEVDGRVLGVEVCAEDAEGEGVFIQRGI